MNEEIPSTPDDNLDIVTELAKLPPGTFVFEAALAKIFGKCQTSIKRAVDRGDLPRPIRFMGRPMWTAGSIIKHVEDKLEDSLEEYHSAKMRAEEKRP